MTAGQHHSSICSGGHKVPSWRCVTGMHALALRDAGHVVAGYVAGQRHRIEWDAASVATADVARCDAWYTYDDIQGTLCLVSTAQTLCTHRTRRPRLLLLTRLQACRG